jgi:tetratricopeptide (TPR) repeat protein
VKPFIAGALAFALSGCLAERLADFGLSPFRGSTAGEGRAELLAMLPPVRAEQGADLHMRRGLQRLIEGDSEAAGAEFRRGLKYDPQSPHLNFLNGYVYHLEARGGNKASYELASVGYRLALKFDPNHWLAAMQLGRLYFDQRLYRNAQNEFSRALLIEPERPDAIYALATASYHAGDARTALAAIHALPLAERTHPEVLRARALIHAAAGLDEDARRDLVAYQGVVDARQGQRAARRIEDWRRFFERARATQLAQIEPRRDDDADIVAPLPPGATVAPAGKAPIPPPPPGLPSAEEMLRQAEEERKSKSPEAKAARDVLVEAMKNRQVILDCIIIRREESAGDRHGVNLLQGLQLQFSGTLLDWKRDRLKNFIAPGSNAHTLELDNRYTLTFPAVTYSLNIANATDSHNRVIGRPSVHALHGEKAEIFMGSELTYSTLGDRGRSYNKEVGVGLRVTPEFLDEGRIKLTIETDFQTFEPTSQGNFDEAVQTSKNAVKSSVIMDFGQTLILGGSSDSQDTSSGNATPMLRDIPVLQYLFNQRTTSRTERSLLVLITPRRPSSVDADDAIDGLIEERPGEAAKIDPAALKEMKERYRHWFRPTSNLVNVMARLGESSLYREFREGDLRLVDLDQDGDVELPPAAPGTPRILRNLIDLMYF